MIHNFPQNHILKVKPDPQTKSCGLYINNREAYMMTNQKASLAIKAVHYKLSNNGEKKGKRKEENQTYTTQWSTLTDVMKQIHHYIAVANTYIK